MVGAAEGGQTTLTVAGYDSRQVAAGGGWNRGCREAVYMHRTVESEHPKTTRLGQHPGQRGAAEGVS